MMVPKLPSLSRVLHLLVLGGLATSKAVESKRDLFDTQILQARSYTLWNETSQDFDYISSEEYTAVLSERSELTKRVWTYDPRWTKAKIARYLSDQADDGGSPDAQFGDMGWLVSSAKNMATVSLQKQFRSNTKAFQMGTGGLHGCTVLTIVSRRAAYMAHYWEVYALNRDDDLSAGSSGLSNFQAKIANPITGQGTKDPITEGPSVNFNWYNRDTDNTRIFIMSPYQDDFKPPNARYTTQMKDLKYPNKVQAIIDLLTEENRIPGAAVVVQGYQRLNWSWDREKEIAVGPDAALVDKTERGIACFQYDGDKHYRLFLEHMMYRDSDEIPG
ncbi:hypothetical protein HJFPF1_07467 [Paramyrothecium foliicola]|nr:hypothetical protein HJFPF1_07467 [Paramyrothecium foliicola]